MSYLTIDCVHLSEKKKIERTDTTFKYEWMTKIVVGVVVVAFLYTFTQTKEKKLISFIK